MTSPAYTDTDTVAGVTWHYRVTALNADAVESAPSTTASAARLAPAPGIPSGLHATGTTTGISLTWTAVTGASGYHVYRSDNATTGFTKLTGTAVTTTAWDDTVAPLGASYYWVTALNSQGVESGPSNTVSALMSKANLLLNPSFEIDANADNRPDSWTSSARFLRSTDSVRSGTYGGRHRATNNASYTVGQTITGLTAGRVYGFSGWVNIPTTTDAFTLAFRIQWRNSSNRAISTQTIATFNAQTGSWVKSTGSYTAPVGTTGAVVNMVVSSLNATVHVDDITLR